MRVLVRASLFSSLIALGLIASGCPAGPGSANAAAPAPPVPVESPEQVVMDVARGLSEGRPYVAWDALPASYQDDVTGIVHAYAANVDRELWNQGFALARRVSMMLRNKKDIILAMPKFQAAEGFDAERVSREWDFVMAPILTIADSELANVDSLQELDVRRFLGTTGVEFMQDIIRISAFAADDAENKLAALGQTQATLVSRDGDNAVVQIAVPGQSPRSKPFVRVEGKWIPKDIADEWADEMDDARAHIAQMSPEKVQALKPTIMRILAGLDTTVDQLDRAQTAQQFEQTLQMGMFQAFGGMMEIAQAMESGDERP